jgi:hypothetical protein
MKPVEIPAACARLWAAAALLALCAGCASPDLSDARKTGRLPRIDPDYAGITVPPNIAPLHFSVREPGKKVFVRIRSERGKPIEIQSRSGAVRTPQKPWRRLLSDNAGRPLAIDVFVQDRAGRWSRFDTITVSIARERMDGTLVYRRFGPLFNQWKKMGIFERNIATFDEKPVLINRLTMNNCMNCHNFWRNGTDRWLLHTRGGPGTSMLLCLNGQVRKIDTRTQVNKSTAGYPAWHPSGDKIAFSAGRPLQFFHTIGETRDELDRYLDIIVYDIPSNTVTTTPELSSPDRVEVWPEWSKDGRFLYFCSAPKIDAFFTRMKSGDDTLAYGKIKFDLMRIAYDAAKNSWGRLETVLSSKETGLSVTQPKISPDGRFMVCTLSEYGSFPVFHGSADLYLLDLARGKWKKLELNSDRAEGYHSWSSDGRWIVFSSKRQDTQFTAPYFSRIDSAGNASKPFVLPQNDPDYYQSCLDVFNVPEFATTPVRVSAQALAAASYSKQNAVTEKPDPGIMKEAR